MRRSRGALAAIVCAFVAVHLTGIAPVSAATKTFPSKVTLDEVTSGTSGSVSGAIESSNFDCVNGRTIKVLDGNTVLGTTQADEGGDWQLDAPVSGGSNISAKAEKLILKKSKKRRQQCASATSRVVKVPFELTVNVIGDGIVDTDPAGISCTQATSPCTSTFGSATDTAVQATPRSGASFTSWGGACSADTDDVCNLRIDSNKTVTATFTTVPPPVTRVLELVVTGPGSVTGNGIDCNSGGGDCVEDYPINTPVTLTATPNTILDSFDGWGESCSGTQSTCQLTMNTDRTATASFSSQLPLPGPLASLLAQILDALAGLLG